MAIVTVAAIVLLADNHVVGIAVFFECSVAIVEFVVDFVPGLKLFASATTAFPVQGVLVQTVDHHDPVPISV